MHTFLSFIKGFRFPKKKELERALDSLSRKQFGIFIGAIVVVIVSVIVLLAHINAYFLVDVPADGGSLREGVVGAPTLINPVLALSDADKDVTALVYSGLMRKDSDGSFVPDLAESYTVSPDGMTYTFKLRDTAIFQDGTKVTADDVVFTIEKIQDPQIKSPRKLSWDGVTVSKQDDMTVVFTLKQAYISFMDNTTTGILPSHAWQDISASEFSLNALNNTKAIGSGPYKIVRVVKNADGVPQEYDLDRFAKFALGTPHISSISIVSYANENTLVHDLVAHKIDQAGSISPENADKVKAAGFVIHTATLPRLFGLFFNTSKTSVLADKSVRQAINIAVDRSDIVDQVLHGYGTPIASPVPETIMKADPSDASYISAQIDQANALLDKAGWKIGANGIRQKGGTTTQTVTKKVGKKTVTQKVTVNNGPLTYLSFTITTGDTPELKEATFLIKEELEAIGANVDVKVYGTGDLNTLIRSRDYEALFFGQVVNHESDLYSFWHSSQIADPGLNIARYSNTSVDAILSQAQKTSDGKARISTYDDFVRAFQSDVPAVLVYSPAYLYATSSHLNNLTLESLTQGAERFAQANTWYADTDHVWKIFAH